MKFPAWVSRKGLLEHLIIGGAFGLLLLLVGIYLGPAAEALLAIAGMFAAHEWADGDFTVEIGAPLNGVVDVLAALPIPTIVYILWLVIHKSTTH